MALDEPVRRLPRPCPGRHRPRLVEGPVDHERQIKVGAWLPFTASEDCDGRPFPWHAGGLLHVLGRFADGTEGRLFGRRRLFRADGPETARSAAGRAALEAIWAPVSLLPHHDVTWRPESDDHIVASFDVPPERVDLHLRVEPDGALRSGSALPLWERRTGHVRPHSAPRGRPLA